MSNVIHYTAGTLVPQALGNMKYCYYLEVDRVT